MKNQINSCEDLDGQDLVDYLRWQYEVANKEYEEAVEIESQKRAGQHKEQDMQI